MAYTPKPISRIPQIHNSTHHFEKNTSWNEEPEMDKSNLEQYYNINIRTSGAVHFTGIFPPDVM